MSSTNFINQVTPITAEWLNDVNNAVYNPSTVSSSQSFDAVLQGFPTQTGTTWQTQFHPNWNVVQTTLADNPTEWQVYSGASGGIVQTISGTNQITWNSGAQFSTYWAGLPYLYVDGTLYKVLAVTSATSLTVQTTVGGDVSWGSTALVPYYFATTSVKGICNVNGTSVTWVSGTPFILYPTTIIINGVSYTISVFNSPTSLTLASSAGTVNGASYAQYTNINNELACLRLQSTAYADQENFCITQTANGAILETQYGGNGKYRPIKIRTGEQPAGKQQVLVALYPNATLGQPGTLLLGGDFNNQVLNIAANNNNVNYFFVNGGPTGFQPSLAMRGADTNVGLGIDLQAAGTLTVTSHSFANIEFQVFGVGGSSWLGIGSSTSAAPILSANGAASNIDIKLSPKGTGAVWVGAWTTNADAPVNGYITVKDSSGIVRKLATIA